MKKLIIFTILILTISSFANEWKPGEWLLTTHVYLPSPTKEERNKLNPKTKKKELFPKSFHQRMFDELPEEILPTLNSNFITHWGTTKWERAEAVGECPLIKNEIPECSIFFAAKYWISPEKQNANLWFGSDDAVKIWLNRKEITTCTANRGYKYGANVIQVSLEKGTNIFVFAVINGEGPSMIGAHLFPKEYPINPGFFLDTENFVETDDYIELNFYWFPAAIVKPRKKIYDNKPKCEDVKVLDCVGNIVTQIVTSPGLRPPPQHSRGQRPSKAKTGVCRWDFPIRIDMRGKSNGIYRIESVWNNEKHSRSFYYCANIKNLTPSEEWKIEMLKDNDFFSPGTLLRQMFGDKKSRKTKGYFGSKRIHAYKSDFDNSLQPYVVMLPYEYEFITNLPMVVILRPYVMGDKIQYCEIQRYNDRNMIQVYPYSRGCSGFRGISEKDVLKVIDLVCNEYKIDRDKIYLEGASFGANGCWQLGGRYPDLFAGVIPDSGYDLKYANNFTALPIWQIWSKANGPGYYLPLFITNMKKAGMDAKYTDIRNLNNKENMRYLKDRVKWFLTKKRNSQPDKVSYSTYGDADGAYWIRNIMPEWFGRMGMVEAEVLNTNIQYSINNNQCSSEEEIPLAPFKKGGLINVWLENVASFSLDLRKGRFLKFKSWVIVINDEIKTNAPSGEMFAFEMNNIISNIQHGTSNYEVKNTPPRPSGTPPRQGGELVNQIPLTPFIKGGIIKRNGFCGGIADVVCDSFIFAYSAEDEKAKERAEKFNYAITGIKANQFDGKFKVIPDTDLTKEICEKYNVILFTSNEKYGKFLEGNIEKLPFEIVDGKLKFLHVNVINTYKSNSHKQEPGIRRSRACVTFPNPLAANRYLLTVTMTNFTPKILIREPNDIILGYRRGSFDKNWDKIQWQDEFQPPKHKHNEHNFSDCGDQHNIHSEKYPLEKEIYSKSKRKLWKKYGLIICFLGIAVFYAYDYFVRKYKKQ